MGQLKNTFLLVIIAALPTLPLISKTQGSSNTWRTIGIVSGTAATIGLLELAFNKDKRTALLRLVQKKNRDLTRGTVSPNVTIQVASGTAFALISAFALYKSNQNSDQNPNQPQALKALMQETGIQTDSVATIDTPPLLTAEQSKNPKNTLEEMSVQTIDVTREEIGIQTENVAVEKPTLPVSNLIINTQVGSTSISPQAAQTASVQTGRTPAQERLGVSTSTPCGIAPKSPINLEIQAGQEALHISPLSKLTPRRLTMVHTSAGIAFTTPQRKLASPTPRHTDSRPPKVPLTPNSPGLNRALWSRPKANSRPYTPEASPFTKTFNEIMKRQKEAEFALQTPTFSSEDDDGYYSDGSIGTTSSSPARIERARNAIQETDLTLQEQADLCRRNIGKHVTELRIYRCRLHEIEKLMNNNNAKSY
ncbi:MAG: hypothetical protein QG632_113, partial [Candidatus Dependentiae bacterium]|nr:hypothetical protein [Candidatus Dependentiae bacterium]